MEGRGLKLMNNCLIYTVIGRSFYNNIQTELMTDAIQRPAWDTRDRRRKVAELGGAQTSN